MTDYAAFLDAKTHLGGEHGFDPLWLPDDHFPFQVALSEWEIRKGRSATFAGCGLGKSRLAITRAENVVRKANGRDMAFAPSSAKSQFFASGSFSGRSVARYRACFGSRRSSVRIWPPRQQKPRATTAVVALGS